MKLKACPFCGSDDVDLTPGGYVLCNGCLLLADFANRITTTGGIDLCSEGAWAYQWNRRTGNVEDAPPLERPDRNP